MDEKTPRLQLVTDREEMLAKLEDMLARHLRGELPVVALRVYATDGTWEDLVLGDGTDEEIERAKADLLRGFASRH